MHTCEFCHTQFTPRSQVKTPRACNKDMCQRQRQRDNERSWRERHKHLEDKNYHQIRRHQRRKKIHDIGQLIFKCMAVGREFLGIPIYMENMRTHFIDFLLELGIRRINKLCSLENLSSFRGLEQQEIDSILQTSLSAAPKF